jgi:hypothetical protein
VAIGLQEGDRFALREIESGCGAQTATRRSATSHLGRVLRVCARAGPLSREALPCGVERRLAVAMISFASVRGEGGPREEPSMSCSSNEESLSA